MALRNFPLTPAEISEFIDLPMMRLTIGGLWNADPLRYDEVHYIAARDETFLADRSMFYFLDPSSPSDSTWMVPGTEHRRY